MSSRTPSNPKNHHSRDRAVIQIGILGPISDLYAISYEGRVPKRGDSRDMQHVLLSSATDALVTNDKNLRRLMNRRRIDGYECISFRELLEEIQ